MEETTLRISQEDLDIFEDIWLRNYETEEDPGTEQLVIQSIDWKPHDCPPQEEWDVWLCGAQAEHFQQWLSDQARAAWKDYCDYQQEYTEIKDEDTKEYMDEEKDIYDWCRKMLDQFHAFHHPYYVVKGYGHPYETWSRHNSCDGNRVMEGIIYAMRHESDPEKKWVVVYDLQHEEIFRLGPVPEGIKEMVDATTAKYAR